MLAVIGAPSGRLQAAREYRVLLCEALVDEHIRAVPLPQRGALFRAARAAVDGHLPPGACAHGVPASALDAARASVASAAAALGGAPIKVKGVVVPQPAPLGGGGGVKGPRVVWVLARC